jgi:hypothetical protein
VPEQARRILNLVNEHGRRMTLEKSARFFFSLLSFGGRSKETNASFGKRHRKVEVLPVCLAPVSTTTGRVFAELMFRFYSLAVLFDAIKRATTTSLFGAGPT